jgi:hypothetical protein
MIDSLDQQLVAVHERHKGRNDSPEAKAAAEPILRLKTTALRQALAALRQELGPVSAARLDAKFVRVREGVSAAPHPGH